MRLRAKGELPCFGINALPGGSREMIPISCNGSLRDAVAETLSRRAFFGNDKIIPENAVFINGQSHILLSFFCY